jgi:putative hydrolase of the HAD superfamily
MPSLSELDAVTVDAFGTLVELDDPVGRLSTALARRSASRKREQVAAAFAEEVAYYLEHKVLGRDEASLARLRRDCAAVFLRAAEAELDPAEFAPAFVEALVFRPFAGAVEALGRLRAAGLTLACVSNWDVGLAEQLDRAGVARLFETVVSSAELGAEKPEPAVFLVALERLGVAPARALHVGDSDGDREGAAAAGLAFEPAPLATLPERLGLPPKR